jgi:hypothetical protein
MDNPSQNSMLTPTVLAKEKDDIRERLTVLERDLATLGQALATSEKTTDFDRFKAGFKRSSTSFFSSAHCPACASKQEMNEDDEDHEHELQLFTLPLNAPDRAPRLVLEFQFDSGGNFVGSDVVDVDEPDNGTEEMYVLLVDGQARLGDASG